MNTGQMLLALGAVILLSMLSLRINNTTISTQSTIVNSKMGLMAVSIAQSVIEEANNKAFDEISISAFVSDLNKLTLPTQLKAESGEKYPDFDDFDDYNNFNRTDTIPTADIFKVKCKVYYIDPSAPNVPVSTRGWHKKIDVSVISETMRDTIKISSVFSYWKEL
jgi:hypothetical protein